MKTRTHSYLASMIAAVALTHPAASAADDRLWREQISAPSHASPTLHLIAARHAPTSDDWLWREQVGTSGQAPVYVVHTTNAAAAPAHALWREQLGRNTRHSTPSVAESSQSGAE